MDLYSLVIEDSPEDGTPIPKTCKSLIFVMNYISLSAFLVDTLINFWSDKNLLNFEIILFNGVHSLCLTPLAINHNFHRVLTTVHDIHS